LASDISTLSTIASAAAAWIALALSILNARTSRRALRLSEQQEARRKPSLAVYLQEGLVSTNPQRDARIYALLLSVSNRSDNNNSVAEATLHLTYSRPETGEFTVKFAVASDVPPPFERNQVSLPVPKRIDAHQAISGWYYFCVDSAILSNARIERTIVMLRDTYGNEIAAEPLILREYSDEDIRQRSRENVPQVN
jgi:hypothetical protein